MAKDTENKAGKAPENTTTEPKADPAKGSLKTNIVWAGKELKAGAAVPEGLMEWLKKAKKNFADYIVE
jgi:hypothetical protein